MLAARGAFDWLPAVSVLVEFIHVAAYVSTPGPYQPNNLSPYLCFSTQKHILVDYGLRRITFLVAQEVSPSP